MYPQPQDPWDDEGAQPSPQESAGHEALTEPIPATSVGRAGLKERWKAMPMWGRLLSLGGAAALLCCCGLFAIALVSPAPPESPSPVGGGSPTVLPSTTAGPPSSAVEEGDRPAPTPRQPSPPTLAPPVEPPPEEPVAPPEEPAPPAEPTDEVETRIETETEAIPYETDRVEDPNLPEGTEEVRRPGRDGEKTQTYEVTLTNGLETDRKLVKEKVTRDPVNEVIAVGTMAEPESEPEPRTSSEPECHPNYEGACVPIAEDVDCEGGTGNGPEYVRGPVRVVGEDVYDLDRDGNGIGCED